MELMAPATSNASSSPSTHLALTIDCNNSKRLPVFKIYKVTQLGLIINKTRQTQQSAIEAATRMSLYWRFSHSPMQNRARPPTSRPSTMRPWAYCRRSGATAATKRPSSTTALPSWCHPTCCSPASTTFSTSCSTPPPPRSPSSRGSTRRSLRAPPPTAQGRGSSTAPRRSCGGRRRSA